MARRPTPVNRLDNQALVRAFPRNGRIMRVAPGARCWRARWARGRAGGRRHGGAARAAAHLPRRAAGAGYGQRPRCAMAACPRQRP
jgi:hypothetical protein